MVQVSRKVVILLSIAASACNLANCTQFAAVFNADGNRQCAVGKPDDVRLSTNTATVECLRLCDDNPECVVFNLYDNTTCEIFTCPSALSLGYQIVEFCKSFRIDDFKFRCRQPACDIPKPQDCSDVRARGYSDSGVYRVYPGNKTRSMEMDVYCDFSIPGQSWLVFQRRKDGSVNFEQTWYDYAAGFGNVNGEFWLGNEQLHLLTSNRQYKLRIDMEDFDGQKRYAEFSTFSISSSTDRYILTVSGYMGDAGDSFSGYSGMQFSTKDADNDLFVEESCALLFHGAWWYWACHSSNLNGLYLGGPQTSFGDGIIWETFRGYSYSLKTTEMKIAVAV